MVPQYASVLVLLAGLCFDTAGCSPEADQSPLKSAKHKKILAACPAYEHYARFPQYGATPGFSMTRH